MNISYMSNLFTSSLWAGTTSWISFPALMKVSSFLSANPPLKKLMNCYFKNMLNNFQSDERQFYSSSMYLFYSKRMKCIKKFYFCLQSVKLSYFADLNTNHLRTTPPSENITQLLLRCVKMAAGLRLVQSWSSKQLTTFDQQVFSWPQIWPCWEAAVEQDSAGTWKRLFI